MEQQKTPLELLNEVKEAIDFQLIVAQSTNESSISLTKEHAYVCLVAVEKLISRIEKSNDPTK